MLVLQKILFVCAGFERRH